ncbi:Rho GTPase activation protein [Piedraia hortae CBS 480.64]|uniref:Rho GTPase activation protein n=1 Tax=Piedraia hortae CBS 480.64 TaxID=1314780 RepID=A0A6A7BSQ6_9PEZI|nr:Rho GTPase activation protein [Piedraia hortae CBS 480.64]
MLAKAAGNVFARIGKFGRSSYSHNIGSGYNKVNQATPLSENGYTLKILILPLVEQARMTRNGKTPAECHDSIEFWIPSLPCRCIEYLADHSYDEGLYRIPGSAERVLYWQNRFDSELDIELPLEQELNDPNEISSLLKKWFNNIPTPVVPHDMQNELTEELEKGWMVGNPVPQRMRDILSQLHPCNYYLLFAMTRHLNSMLGKKRSNKMTLQSLSICVRLSLDLKERLFYCLVGDWKSCWQGCRTEIQALQEEVKLQIERKANEKGG